MMLCISGIRHEVLVLDWYRLLLGMHSAGALGSDGCSSWMYPGRGAPTTHGLAGYH